MARKIIFLDTVILISRDDLTAKTTYMYIDTLLLRKTLPQQVEFEHARTYVH